MQLKLIGTELCPYVQRSVITIKHKNVPCDIEFIDLNNPPEIFKTLSPLGRVPLLIVDEGDVIFESTVINEFIDEISPPSLHSSDPIIKAQHRAWIEFTTVLLSDLYTYFQSNNNKEFYYKSLIEKLRVFNNRIGHGPYFSGRNFNLIDTAVAPFLRRFHLAKNFYGWKDDFPKMHFLWTCLEDVDAVKQSFPQNFDQRFYEYLKTAGRKK